MKGLLFTMILFCMCKMESNPKAPLNKVSIDSTLKSDVKTDKNQKTETHIEKVESDSQILTKNDPNKDNIDLNDTSNDKCNKALMGLFNLEGLKTPVTKVHKHCPNVTRSCCNDGDETRTIEIWMSQQEGITEKYYENFLNSMKYLLGFSQEILQLSLDFTENDNDEILEEQKTNDRIKRHLLQNNSRMLANEHVDGDSQEVSCE